MEKLRIATFNVNSIRSRIETVKDWIIINKPDIFCFQETKVQDRDFPRQIFDELEYHVAFRGKKSYEGVAIASRHAPDDVCFGFHDRLEPDEPRLLRANIHGIHIVNTYVPQGREPDHPMFEYKLEWFKSMKKLFTEKYNPGMNVIWCGDLNVAPEPMDVYDSKKIWGHVCHRQEVTDALNNVMDWGFEDILRKFHPEPGQFTYFDYRVNNAVDRKIGWRVDHILASRAFAVKAVNSWIDVEPRKKIKPSDHTILVADFEI
jgi:exodeoxyribonuclease-3